MARSIVDGTAVSIHRRVISGQLGPAATGHGPRQVVTLARRGAPCADARLALEAGITRAVDAVEGSRVAWAVCRLSVDGCRCAVDKTPPVVGSRRHARRD